MIGRNCRLSSLADVAEVIDLKMEQPQPDKLALLPLVKRLVFCVWDMLKMDKHKDHAHNKLHPCQGSWPIRLSSCLLLQPCPGPWPYPKPSSPSQRTASKSSFNIKLQLQASTSSFNFQHQLQASTSSFNVKLQIQASAFSLNFKHHHQLPASTLSFNFKLQCLASTTGFTFKLRLQASTSSFNCQPPASSFNFKLEVPASNSSFKRNKFMGILISNHRMVAGGLINQSTASILFY